MSRGVEVIGVSVTVEGWPILQMMCDCGHTTNITLLGLSEVPSGSEFAFTCDCESSHWITISVGPKDDDS